MRMCRITASCLITAATYFLPISCSKIQKLDVLPSPSDRKDAATIYWSPIVVVGVVRLDQDLKINRIQDWDHQKGVEFSLHRLSLSVENVLRGADIKPNQSLYYFEFAGSYDGPVPLRFWTISGKEKAGQIDRRIFFCRYDHGLLRLSCDGANNCTIPIGSGKHSDHPELREADFRKRLAYIKLTKGEGVSNHEFAQDLGKHCGWLDGCSSDLPEMKVLMRDPDPEIKQVACHLLLDSEFEKPLKARDSEVGRACREFLKPSR